MSHTYESSITDPAARKHPSFCARCLKPFPADARLSCCSFCGEPLRLQGYCSVCQDYWRLPVGASCPKHDVALDADGPPSLPVDEAGKPFTWATVSTFTDSQAAEPPRIRLEAEGIPTFVDGERMGSRSMYHVATGGVRLKVPDHLAADARIILSQTWKATAAELDIEEHDDGDDSGLGQASLPAEAPSLRSSLILFLAVGLPSLLLLLYLFFRSRT